MKNFTKYTFGILSLLLMLASCNIDDSILENPAEDDSSFLNIKVDGTDITTIENVNVSVNPNLTGFFLINGNDDNSSFQLTLESPTSTGTFITMVDEITALSFRESSNAASWAASGDVGSGSITITEDTDSYMKGTFFFLGVNPNDNTTKEFTEGSFKAQKF